eukprot:RCo018094
MAMPMRCPTVLQQLASFWPVFAGRRAQLRQSSTDARAFAEDLDKITQPIVQFRSLQEEALREGRTFENAAAFAAHVDDHRSLLLGVLGSSTQTWKFDRDMLADPQKLSLSGSPSPQKSEAPVPSPTSVWAALAHNQETQPVPDNSLAPRMGSLRPPAEAEFRPVEPRPYGKVGEIPAHRKLPRSVVRLNSLSPYMGSFVYDTFDPALTPVDFLLRKEATVPWRGVPESTDLPPSVFFTAKCRQALPSKVNAEAAVDEIEEALAQLRDMPPQPRVMTMKELKNLRVNRGNRFAHQHRAKK